MIVSNFESAALSCASTVQTLGKEKNKMTEDHDIVGTPSANTHAPEQREHWLDFRIPSYQQDGARLMRQQQQRLRLQSEPEERKV